MKKLLIAMVGILVAGFLFLMFYGGAMVKGSVEEYGPEFTGTSVSLANVNFSPFTGTASLSGLEIGNPEGFEADKTFSMADITVAMEAATLFSDPVHINELRITDPEIVVEFQGLDLNILDLLENLDEYSSEEESTTNVIIDDLYITGAKVTVLGLPMDYEDQQLILPDIHIKNIGNKEGNEEGTTFALASKETMAAVTGAVTKLIGDAKLNDVLEKGKEVIGKTLKGLFGRKDKEEEDDDGGN